MMIIGRIVITQKIIETTILRREVSCYVDLSLRTRQVDIATYYELYQ